MHTINICKFFRDDDEALPDIRQWVKHGKNPAISASLYPSVDPVGEVRGWTLTVHIDCLQMLKETNVKKQDISIITNRVNNYLSTVGLSIDDMLVSRIDYCVSAVLPAEQRGILLKIYQKALKNTSYVKRSRKYVSSVYYHSKSRVVQVYDKTAERQAKGQAPAPWERDVLRFEVQVKINHIKYKRRQGVDRSWSSWVNWDTRTRYLYHALTHTIYAGDYYTLDRAYTRLKKSGIQGALLNNLRNFMRLISKGRHVEKALEKTSHNTAKRYCDVLQAAGVNPIPIPRRAKISYIKNPFNNLILGGGQSDA